MKNTVLVLLLCAGFTYASAQDVYTSSGKPGYQKHTKKKKKGYDPDKLILGGGITFNFGDGYLSAGIAPTVGYRITDHFSAGVGLGYLYSQVPEYVDPVNPDKVSYFRENIVYPSIWARYFVYRNLFVSSTVEYDFINQRGPGYAPNSVTPTTLSQNLDNTCLFLGVGYKFPLGGRVSLYGELLYDVLQGNNSPYSPGFPTLLHFGFAVGL